MMQTALWFIGLFSVASALALFASTNDATVSIFFPPHRLDMSLNLLMLGLLAFFVIAYLAIRAIRALFALPRRAREWRSAQHETSMRSSLVQSLVQLNAGRFTRARVSAQSALASESKLRQFKPDDPEAAHTRFLANLLAAQSAQALHDSAQRDEAVEQALTVATQSKIEDGQEAILLKAADWALDERDLISAKALLDQLSKGAARRTAALRLRLRYERLAAKSVQALDTARLLSKHKAFTPLQGKSLIRALALEAIDGCQDVQDLQNLWERIHPSERNTTELACRAVLRWLAIGGDGQTALRWLEPLWQHWVDGSKATGDHAKALLTRTLEAAMTRQGADTAWLSRIEGAQKRWPADAQMMYLAAMACWQSSLWGKARQLMNQALPRLRDPELQMRGWQVMAELAAQAGEQEASNQAQKRAFALGLQKGSLIQTGLPEAF